MTTSRFSYSWWLWAFRGLAILLLGIGALSWPEPTLELLIRMIGVVVTAVGAVSFIASATNAYRVGAWNALGLMGVTLIDLWRDLSID